MTTIAYKDGVLACDKQASQNGTRYRASSKLLVTDTHAYAMCGEFGRALHWLQGYLSDDQDVQLWNAGVVQMDLKTGRCHIFEAPGIGVPLEDRLYADGSGGDVALGAMAAGATPEEAVRIASHWDTDTGFGVQVVVSEKARRLRNVRADTDMDNE